MTLHSPKILERSLKALKAANRARRRLLPFTVATFMGEYRVSWHHVLVAQYLDWWRVTPGARLIIELPPRHGKSTLASVHLPPLLMGIDPDSRIIATSYSDKLVRRNSRDMQNIMQSPAYRALFPGVKLGTGARAEGAVSRTQNELEIVGHRGIYLCSPVGGSVTGFGADYMLIDDPHKNRAEAESPAARDNVWNFYTSTARTRLQHGGKILIMMTRWHEDDLIGRALNLAKENPRAEQWVRLRLPAISEPRPDVAMTAEVFAKVLSERHAGDHRKPGEALWPTEFSLDDLLAIEASIGNYDFDALYQARPKKPGGRLIKRGWFTIIDRNQVPAGLRWVRYWDLAVTKNTVADYTASPRAAMDEHHNLYLADMVRLREEWAEVQQRFEQQANIDGPYVSIGVESVGTQKGLVNDLQNLLPSHAVEGYTVSTDKLTRALPWIARARRGGVFLVRGPWISDFLDECADFTGVGDKYDDQIDAVSGIYTMLTAAEEDWVE